MNPSQSKYNFEFTINGNTLNIGLYSMHTGEYVDFLTPVLSIEKGGEWEEVSRYDTLWSDIQEELGEEYLAKSIVDKFNKDIEEYQTGGEMTFNQKLIAIFQLRLALVNETLVLK